MSREEAHKIKKKRQLKMFCVTLGLVLGIGGAGLFALWIAGGGVRTAGRHGGVNAAPVGEGTSSAAYEREIVLPAAGSRGVLQEAAAAEASATLCGTPEAGGIAAEMASAVPLGSGFSPEHRYIVETKVPEEVTLGFVGDILLDPEYSIYKTYVERGCVPEACVEPQLIEELRSVDVLTVNNEFPYSDRGEAQEGKTFTFRASPASVSILKELGADLASVANNHAFDYGEEAFCDTLTTLAGAGIPYLGAGKDIEEAMTPVVLYAAGMKIGIVASTQIERQGAPDSLAATEDRPGMLRSWPAIDPTLEAIRRADEECDIVILFIHWGTESEPGIDWCQEEQLPQFIKAGADVIIGAHPHILQKIEWKGDVPVIYSIGNFWFSSKSVDSCVIELTLAEGNIKELRFVPCRQHNCGVGMLRGEEAERLLNDMRWISPTVSIDGDGVITPR